MFNKRAALKLGLRLVQSKLGQAVGDPSFSISPLMGPGGPLPTDPAEEATAELPTTNEQIRDRSAKIQMPRIVTTR
jgi:hypothetical protein